MFSYIKGILEEKQINFCVVEAQGIGFKINTPTSCINSIGDIGDTVKLYTYQYIREDIMALYGFIKKEELNMFELLISVSGVGPKAAVSIISNLSVSEFGLCAVNDDSKKLTKAPGIGEKIAKRIILELKDKIKKEYSIDFSTNENDDLKSKSNIDANHVSEAISALCVLGYRNQEINKALTCFDYNIETSAESIIKKALNHLGNGGKV